MKVTLLPVAPIFTRAKQVWYNMRIMKSSSNESNPQKYYYSWQQFDEDCNMIAEWAKDKKFKTIYGIPRGGLIIAVKLSHLLDIPMVLNKDDITRQTLIVDDIVDTGTTVERFYLSTGINAPVASLFVGKDAAVQPNKYIHLKADWIVFPWETEETSAYDDTLSKMN